MHEMTLAQDMIRIIERTLGGKVRLERVNVTIGPLAGISGESLRFCFTEIARLEDFGEPELTINYTKARLLCLDCREEYSSDDLFHCCPRCGSIRKRVLSGREFTVDSVELEEGEEPDG